MMKRELLLTRAILMVILQPSLRNFELLLLQLQGQTLILSRHLIDKKPLFTKKKTHASFTYILNMIFYITQQYRRSERSADSNYTVVKDLQGHLSLLFYFLAPKNELLNVQPTLIQLTMILSSLPSFFPKLCHVS